MIRRDSAPLIVALLVSAAIMGWIVWSQSRDESASAGSERSEATSAETPAAAPVLDTRKAETLRQAAERDPKDVASRIELGDLYFDAHQFDRATDWYDQALALDPSNVNVSTDLGVAYYYTSQPDRALAQFEHSLELEPAHAQTMLNIGIVRAFGKQDLAGAREIWQRVIDRAPDSPEAGVAREALQRLESAPPGAADPGAPGGRP